MSSAQSGSSGLTNLARRIVESTGPRDDAAIVAAIRSQAPAVRDIIGQLAKHRNPKVRIWAAGAAHGLIGRDAAVELLLGLSERDHDDEVRNAARSELIDIDPALLKRTVPHLIRSLETARDGHGDAQLAMWSLAHLRAQEAVPVLLRYAERFPSTHYDHRMPVVLARYLTEPGSVAARIRSHDHDWMYWLVEAATLIHAPGGLDAVMEGADNPPDGECGRIFRQALEAKLPFRWPATPSIEQEDDR